MRVLLVSSNYPPDIGGPAASVDYISKELGSKGVDTIIATNGTFQSCTDPVNVIRTDYVKQKKHSITGALLRIYYLFKLILKTGKDFDVLHSQDVNISGIPTMLAAAFLRKPYIVKFSGDMYVEYQLRRGKSADYALRNQTLIKRLFDWVQRQVCNRSRFTIATSKFVKNHLLNMGVEEERIKLIPNGVVKQEIDKSVLRRIRSRYGKNLVCTSCRVTKIKGISTLINASKKLLDYSFIVFGDGKDMNYFKRLVKQEEASNFYFHGRVSHKKVQSYIKACDVFVLASFYEPFGIAVLDAMCANIPVIVSDAGGMNEIVANNTGLVFKTGDVNDFIAKLRRIKTINLKNQRMHVKNYYWKKITSDYVKLYKEVLKR